MPSPRKATMHHEAERWVRNATCRRLADPRPDAEGRTEEARLLAACDAGPHWLGPMVRLALATAMRQGELLALEWHNIDQVRRDAKAPRLA